MTSPVLSEIHPLLYKTLKTLQCDNHRHTSYTDLVSMVFIRKFLFTFLPMKCHLTQGFPKGLGPSGPKNHHFHSLFSHKLICSLRVVTIFGSVKKTRVQLETNLTAIYIKLICHSQLMSCYHFIKIISIL